MQDHRDSAEKLLSVMTIEEKTAQLCSVWLRIEESGRLTVKNLESATAEDSAEDPLSIMKNGIGELTRPLGTYPINAKKAVKALNGVQKFLREGTRLGIPALAHEECLPGLMAYGATLFPSGLNYGSLWDAELMRKFASVIGDELYSVGARQGLSPVLDVSRDVRWGRTDETLGEDPYLVGCMASAYVRGLQGDNRRLLATLKHFVGHSFCEGGRNHAPVRIGNRELNDVFMLPFEMAVKTAGAGSVMPAYHDLDGEPCSASIKNITEILRNEWGFDGIVVADYEAVSQLHTDHRIARDAAESAAIAIRAGLDIELPGYTCFRTGIIEAIDRGLLSVRDLNAAVLRVLTEKYRLGLFDNPYIDVEGVCLNSPEHRSAAREAAQKSIVLLKNDGILPLSSGGGTTAVIGSIADDRMATLCGYSFPVHLITAHKMIDSEVPYAKTLLEVMREREGETNVLFAAGCDVLRERPLDVPVFPGDTGMKSGQRESYVSTDESGIQEAVKTASEADRIVFAAGDLAGLFLSGTVGEGSDVSSLVLPGVQAKLLDALLETGKPLIVVLMNGRPYSLGKALKKTNAVVEAWLPGQEGAEAIADVLFGNVNPGGKLPVSVPKSAGAMPYFYNHKMKSAGAPVQEDFGADFPFGHGLSYTEFRYGGFSLDSASVPVDGEFRLSLSVENSGERTGEEIVQLYVRDLQASVVRPVMELKGFKRISLVPGQSARLTFSVPVDMLGFTVSGTQRIVEPGDFDLMIGSSSDDIRYRTKLTVTGTARLLPNDWRMMSQTNVVYTEKEPADLTRAVSV